MIRDIVNKSDVMRVMDSFNNNQFEIKPTAKAKRKITTPSANVYLNPALDLLANEDPICNTAMEIVPKKRKRTKSCDITTFENTALDLGISKAAVNEFLAKELDNVRRNTRSFDLNKITPAVDEPIYANVSEINMPPPQESCNNESLTLPQNSFTNDNLLNMPNTSGHNAHESFSKTQNYSQEYFNNESLLNMQENLKHTFTNATLDLSEIRANDDVLDSGISELEHKSLNVVDSEMGKDSSATNVTNIQTNITNQILVNNPSNLSLSFIDRLALDSPNVSNRSLYFDDDLNESNIMEIKTITIITKKKKIPEKISTNTNPFLNPNIGTDVVLTAENPFLNGNETKAESEYNAEAVVQNDVQTSPLMPRRLFAGDTNSTISTMNESVSDNHEYENIDDYRSESPIYENEDEILNKQSKILGYDVSQFSAIDIMNLNKINQANSSNESNDSKKDFKHQFLKAGNKLSKKVFKTLRRTFKTEKLDQNVTLNPYEVPRKPSKTKQQAKDAGFENPALNLDISDDIEIEEIDGVEHTYETIKTLRNTRLNMNVTPLKERNCEAELSHNRTNTPGKKVRFDSTLNQEKVITGNSFDGDLQSPGFDAKIDKYHDELENCINERKFLQQNM